MKPFNKILIVDDAELVHNIYRVRFGSMNVVILSARNGSEAIDIISKESDIKFIILDLNMSSMNGLDFLKTLPGSYKQKVPVIVVSSEQDKGKQLKALRSGAAKFFEKGKIKELKEFIEPLLGNTQMGNVGSLSAV